MTRVEQTAHVTPADIRAADLPEFDIEKVSVVDCAHLIWVAVRRDIPDEQKRYPRGGIPGRLWEGVLARMIDHVMPELGMTHLISREDAKQLRRDIHGYLKTSGNMVCQRKGAGGGVPSIWWLSEYWCPLTVTQGEKAAPVLKSVPEPEIQDIQIPAPAQEPEPVVAAHKFAMGGLTGPNYGPVCRFCPNPPGHPLHAVTELTKKPVPEAVPVEKEAAKVESPEPDLWVADTFQRVHDFLDIAGEKLAEEAARRESVLRSEIETLTSLLETAEAERDDAYAERDRLREQSDGPA